MALNLGLIKREGNVKEGEERGRREGREGRERVKGEKRERIEGGGERGGMDVQGTDDDHTLSVLCTEYLQPGTRFCLPCPSICEGCTGPSSTDCLQCAAGLAQEFNDDRSS